MNNLTEMNAALKTLSTEVTVTKSRSITDPRWMIMMSKDLLSSNGGTVSFDALREKMESFGLKYTTYLETEYMGMVQIEFIPAE